MKPVLMEGKYVTTTPPEQTSCPMVVLRPRFSNERPFRTRVNESNSGHLLAFKRVLRLAKIATSMIFSYEKEREKGSIYTSS